MKKLLKAACKSIALNCVDICNYYGVTRVDA